MILTRGQSDALKMVEGMKDFVERPQLCVMAGYAGTGKTTLLSRVPEALGGYPMVIAPTGKAAIRVKEATGIAAKTIHSWLYDAEEDELTGDVVFERKETAKMKRGEISVLVIDEASMVGPDVWDDIYDACAQLHLNILIVGDPFQLPPVVKENSEEAAQFSLLSPEFRYDKRILLTEIVRQALDNPIIRASMLIREGKIAAAIRDLPKLFPAQVLDKAAEIIRAGDGALIVHKNETRNRMNIAVRAAMHKPEHQIAEKEPLLVLQNNYRLQRFNGEVVRFMNWIEPPGLNHKVKDRWRKQEGYTTFGVAQLEPNELDPWAHAVLCVEQVLGRFGHISQYPINKLAEILYGRRAPDPYEASGMSQEELNEALGPPLLAANFGYCLTCHKSQGSEWNRVIVSLEPSIRLQTEEGVRWTYTAITRAKEEVWINIGGPK